MSSNFRVGVLVSGAGTNLQAIIDRVHKRAEIEVVAVASNQPTAFALQRAQQAGIETNTFALDHYADRAARDAGIASWLVEKKVDLVVLAGYMHLLSPAFIKTFQRRIINIHPSLLPAFPGTRAIEQALDYGVKVVGVTVHFVDDGIDTGPIIAQRAIELSEPITAERVRKDLSPLEHTLLCQTIQAIAEGELTIDPDNDRRVLTCHRSDQERVPKP